MAMAPSSAFRPASARSRVGVGRFGLQVVFWLLMSLLLSLMVEWIGMTFWWPDQGAQHAVAMYEAERAHLAGDLGRSVLVQDPSALADWLVSWVEAGWQGSGLVALLAWLKSSPGDGVFGPSIVAGLHDYAVAAVFVTLVFAVRLAILLLSLPLFILFGLVGLVDGLVERDLRRFSVGRESAYVFHIAKRATTPMVILAWALYLSMPVTVHPALVIIPFAIIFALFVRFTAASFKKYL